MVLDPRLNHYLLLLPLVVTSSLGLIIMPYLMVRDWWCHRLVIKGLDTRRTGSISGIDTPKEEPWTC